MGNAMSDAMSNMYAYEPSYHALVHPCHVTRAICVKGLVYIHNLVYI